MTRSEVFAHVSGLLLDLDGVAYVGDTPLPGAVEAIRYLRDRNIPFRFTTNTTTRSIRSLHQKLVGLGLPVEPHEIFGVIRAAQAYLRSLGEPTLLLLVTDDPKADFAEFRQSETNPTHILLGDLGKDWDHQLLQRCFTLMMNGAELVALHKGRYWQTEAGLRVDLGAFVAGLEYVTGKGATVIGKPSTSFFDLALADLGLPRERVVMIGDDIVNDVQGAQRAGMKGVLVRTGKYREDLIARSGVVPDLVIDSIADLLELL